MLQEAAGRIRLGGRVGFVGGDHETDCRIAAHAGERDGEVSAVSRGNRCPAQVKRARVHLHTARQDGRQCEMADVKGRGSPVAEGKAVGQGAIVLAHDEVLEDADTRAVGCGRGVGRAFHGEFSTAPVVGIGVGPIPPDDVRIGLGVEETDVHGVLDDAGRGYAAGVLQLDVGRARSNERKLGRGVECGRLTVGVDIQGVEAPRAVVVEGQGDAAIVVHFDEGLEIAGAVEEGEIQDLRGGGASVQAGDLDPEQARGVDEEARVRRTGNGVAVLVPLVGEMAFRGTDQLGVAVLMAA